MQWLEYQSLKYPLKHFLLHLELLGICPWPWTMDQFLNLTDGSSSMCGQRMMGLQTLWGCYCLCSWLGLEPSWVRTRLLLSGWSPVTVDSIFGNQVRVSVHRQLVLWPVFISGLKGKLWSWDWKWQCSDPCGITCSVDIWGQLAVVLTFKQGFQLQCTTILYPVVAMSCTYKNPKCLLVQMFLVSWFHRCVSCWGNAEMVML
jgi:hypothetical protein